MEVSVNKRLMLTILFISFSASLFSQVNPDTLPEKYVKKVIIEAKWGNGPGEFGRKWNSDMQIWEFPTCFGVDYEKKLYVCDFFNGRIVIFDKEGKYYRNVKYAEKGDLKFVPKQMIIGNKKDMYILGVTVRPIVIKGVEVNTTIFEIKKYNQRGDLLSTYDMNYQPIEKFKGEQINRYLSGLPRHYKLEIRDGKIMVGDMIVGTTSKSFQNVKKESNVFNFEFNLKERKEVRVTIGGKSITVRVLKGVYTADYCGTDSEKNIYISEEKESENGKDTLLILKYDLVGRLRSCIKYSENGHIENVVDRKVDNNGNIYLLICSDEGLKILKYEKE